jgi:hypothetical protein
MIMVSHLTPEILCQGNVQGIGNNQHSNERQEPGIPQDHRSSEGLFAENTNPSGTGFKCNLN